MANDPDQETIGPFVEACLAQMRASKKWFATRVLPLSLDQLRWRPRSGSWSIVDCLDHLNRTLVYYLPKIDQAIGQSQLKLRDPARGLVFPESEEDFLKQAEPPIRSHSVTPSALLPVPAVDPGLIVDQFPQLRNRYAKAVLSASRLDLANISIAGSIHPPVHSLAGVIALLAAHDRRHLWQAEQVRNTPGFPASLIDALSLDERLKC